VKKHSERAHSKFSASGSERWFNCPGSVQLSEGVPDKQTEWSKEGTQAHEVLEDVMKARLRIAPPSYAARWKATKEMITYAEHAADFILGLQSQHEGSEIAIETRIYLDFIHPEMFGTFDGAVIDHFGTLHVLDYKYGAGHAVSPRENLQMIFYGVGLAHKFHWNFKNVKLWIIQPRIKGYDGPVFWELPILELKRYVDIFRNAVKKVEKSPEHYNEGPWCHWCKAKSKCPLIQEAKTEKAINIFKNAPLPGVQVDFGKEKTNAKTKSKKEENETDFY